MTIAELKTEVARLCSIRNEQSAEIAKARRLPRAGLIEAQRPTIEAIRTAQRAIVAARRAEVA